MLSHFYLHMMIKGCIECHVSGSRIVGEKTVTIERIKIEGNPVSEEYRDYILSKTTGIYREIERKLGYPPYSLRYIPRNDHVIV
jgi:exosome complex RNA-binding protein Rrp4